MIMSLIFGGYYNHFHMNCQVFKYPKNILYHRQKPEKRNLSHVFVEINFPKNLIKNLFRAVGTGAVILDLNMIDMPI